MYLYVKLYVEAVKYILFNAINAFWILPKSRSEDVVDKMLISDCLEANGAVNILITNPYNTRSAQTWTI